MATGINEIIHKSAVSFKDLPAFSLKSGFRTKAYSYSEIFNYVKRFPEFFKKHEIKPGDKIILLSYNRPEYAAIILGSLWSGITLVPIDYRTNAETIKKFIERTKPKAIFTSNVFIPLFEGIKHKKFTFEDLFEKLSGVETSDAKEMDEDDTAAILFTSGTTGEPKGTVISYRNVSSSIRNARRAFPLPPKVRVLSILPLSHALEMFGGMITAYSFGCHIHYIERINSITIVQALKRYRIQAMAVVPQMLRVILQNIERKVEEEKETKKFEEAQRIAPGLPFFLRKLLFRKVHQALGGNFEFFICGSAPLEIKLANFWENMGIHIYEGYGASETTGFISTNNFNENRLGTVGKLIPGVEGKLADDGQLFVRGDNVISGYYENPEQTAKAFEDGWFMTGDIVSQDKRGFITITGRDKFKIVLPDGKKAYPEDIEKKLNNNKFVIDSTVFGLKTDEGEIVHAELILKDHNKLRTVIDEVNLLLNPHEQILDFGIFPQKDFPRTKTLKVDRDAVRELIEESKTKKIKVESPSQDRNDKLINILMEVSGKKNLNTNGHATLATDLKLDSLKRIELLALIEEELGVSIEELKITPQTTISDLRKLVADGKPIVLEDGIKLPSWQFTNTLDNIRVALQDTLVFPLFNLGIKVEVIHPENINKITTPQLFIFNHVGSYDIAQILRALPTSIRKKTAIAATHVLWDNKFHGFMSDVFGNCFPFVKSESHGAMRSNFERVGDLLDRGYNIAISPEGNITHTGELLKFHTGAGYIGLEMGVPVTPLKIDGYFEIWPEEPERSTYLYWPKKFGTARVIIGEPITFEKGTSYEEATKILFDAMKNLK